MPDRDKILFVDDEQENLKGFRFIYKRYYDIFAVRNAEEALEILKQEDIKLIIADQRMPRISGADLLEKTAKLYPDIIRIVLTGYSDIEAIIKAINKGEIYRYITKPWDKEELKVTIDNALREYNLKMENKGLIAKLQNVNKQLEEANQNLEQKVILRTQELTRQKEELENQKDLAQKQSEQIQKQKEELEKHRNKLEALVKERTADLVKAKNKAEESDKLKSSFLANLSHEIRTPMHAIIGFSELMLNPMVSDEEKEEFIGELKKSSEYLLNLIEGIIEISKLEAGEVQISEEELELHQFLNEFKALYSDILSASSPLRDINISCVFASTQKHFIIKTDNTKLKTVFSNLIENANKFTESGEINFGYSFFEKDNGEPQIEFFVRDTGIGISEESQKVIFDRFRKIEDPQSKLYRGTGVGLSITKKLVELMGGTIRVESTVGKGACFFFTLPLSKPDYEGTRAVEGSTSERSEDYFWEDKHIIIAEDEVANYRFLEASLKPTKINIEWARNGQKTCELVENSPRVDLVLMDLQMPVMNGYEATKTIKKFNNNIPIIAQSAYVLSHDKDAVKDIGCNDIIAKPYQIHQLLKVMSKYLK